MAKIVKNNSADVHEPSKQIEESLRKKTVSSNSVGSKRKWPSTLLTYSRRAKQNTNTTDVEYVDTSSASANPSAPNCSMDVNNDKDTTLKIPLHTTKYRMIPILDFNDPSSLLAYSATELLMMVEENSRLSHTTYNSQSAMVSPSADSSYNLPLVCGSNENQASIVVPFSIGSTSKKNEKLTILALEKATHPTRRVVCNNKSKNPVSSPPPLMATPSAGNKYIQLFPENVNQQPTNEASHNINGHVSWYKWPIVSFDNNLSTGNRGGVGSRSNLMDESDRPITWSEEELDSLWIGVRRHGRGNWNAMLADPGLLFLTCRRPIELAQKWDEELSRFMHNLVDHT